MRGGRTGTRESLTIVAMEAGSRWPIWLEGVAVGAPNVVTIVQQSDQSRAVLVARVLATIAKARTEGKRLDVCAITCNEQSDRNAIIMRAQVAKAAIGEMAEWGPGRVVLTADQRVPPSARSVLLSLSRSLALCCPARDISVGVSFGEYSSGLFPSATRAPEPERVVARHRGAR